MLISIFVVVVLGDSLVYGNVTVRGKVNFRGGPPEHIPDGSILTVKLEDANRMDVGAENLGTAVHKIRDYKSTNELKFEIKEAKRPLHGREASLSAVLNAGWTPNPNGDDWIRTGDFLNDAMHEVRVEDDKNVYDDVNIEIMQLKSGGGDEL